MANRRFFYDKQLTVMDGLLRELVRTLNDNPTSTSGPIAKTPWLERLRTDGVFLVDLATSPANEFGATARQAALA
jgi:hypothetical protein